MQITSDDAIMQGHHQLHDDVFFISFDLDACAMLSQLMHDVPVAYIITDYPYDMRS